MAQQKPASNGISYLVKFIASLCVIASIVGTASAASDADAIRADINTPIMMLLERADARAVVEKHLPQLVVALDDNYDAREFLGSSSLLELSLDDDHVIGFDEELLEKLRAELRALNDAG